MWALHGQVRMQEGRDQGARQRAVAVWCGKGGESRDGRPSSPRQHEQREAGKEASSPGTGPPCYRAAGPLEEGLRVGGAHPAGRSRWATSQCWPALAGKAPLSHSDSGGACMVLRVLLGRRGSVICLAAWRGDTGVAAKRLVLQLRR